MVSTTLPTTSHLRRCDYQVVVILACANTFVLRVKFMELEGECYFATTDIISKKSTTYNRGAIHDLENESVKRWMPMFSCFSSHLPRVHPTGSRREARLTTDKGTDSGSTAPFRGHRFGGADSGGTDSGGRPLGRFLPLPQRVLSNRDTLVRSDLPGTR